jgi:hypothetical protein
MNLTCLGAGVVLAEQLNLYPCFLGLYILPNHEHVHVGIFLVKHFLLQNWSRGCPFQIFYPLCQMQSCIISTALCSIMVDVHVNFFIHYAKCIHVLH